MQSLPRVVRSGPIAPTDPPDPPRVFGSAPLVRTLVAGVGAAGALIELVLPAECAGCATAGQRWCPGCAADLAAHCHPVPRHTQPSPPPPGLVPVVAAGTYAGSLRAAIVAYKDGGRSDLRAHLAPLLADSLARCPRAPGILAVPMPSSAAAVRRRGEAPVETLARAAVRLVAAPAPTMLPALVVTRRVADQSGLGHQGRVANVSGAYAVRPAAVRRLAGAPVLLVDDVLTTGATLAEGTRAIRAAGGRVLAAAVVAATRRHAWTPR